VRPTYLWDFGPTLATLPTAGAVGDGYSVGFANCSTIPAKVEQRGRMVRNGLFTARSSFVQSNYLTVRLLRRFRVLKFIVFV